MNRRKHKHAWTRSGTIYRCTSCPASRREDPTGKPATRATELAAAALVLALFPRRSR